jgi:hypothetical protein
LESGVEIRSEPLDLKSDAADFVRRWLDALAAARTETSDAIEGEPGE